MLPFLTLACSVIFLAVFGAGKIRGSMYVVTAFVSIAMLVIARNSKYRDRFALPSTVICFGMIVWMFLTTLSLPRFTEMVIGERRRLHNERARTVLNEAAAINLVDRPSTNFPFSRNKSGTLRRVIFFIAVFSAFGLASCLNSRWKMVYLRFLTIAVAIIAVLGIIGQHVIPQYGKIWWRLPVPEGEPVACFVNRSHFGGFVVLLCPAVMLLFALDIEHKRWGLAVLGVVLFAAVSIAVVTSMSRGAFVTYALSLVISVLFAVRPQHKLIGLAVSLLAFVSFISLLIFLGGEVEARLRSLSNLGSNNSGLIRLTVWEDSYRAWRDYPLLGVGADGFRMIIPQYKTADINRSFFHPESEYLQLLVDGGSLGILLALGLIIGYGRCLLKSHHDRVEHRIFLTCALCALLCAAFHAIADVSPSIPLVGFVLASLAGLPVRLRDDAQPAGKMSLAGTNHTDVVPEAAQSVYSRNDRPTSSKPSRLMIYYALFALVFVGGIYYFYRIEIYDINKSDYIMNAEPHTLARAINFAPTSWHAWYHLGLYAFLYPKGEGFRFVERCFYLAAIYNPSDPRVWRELMKIRFRLGDGAAGRWAQRRMLLTMSDSERIEYERQQRN